MYKKTEYHVTFKGEPIMLCDGTERLDLDKILENLGATSITIVLHTSTVKLNLALMKERSLMTVTFQEYEEEP